MTEAEPPAILDESLNLRLKPYPVLLAPTL